MHYALPLALPEGEPRGAACSCAICHNSTKKRSASAPIRSGHCLTKGPACEQAGPFCSAAALRRIRERRNPALNPIVGEIAGQSLSQQKQKPAYPRGHAGFCWRRTLAPVTRPTPLAGAPLRPLEYFSRAKSFGNDSLLMAERVGFEPTARCRVTGFQDRLLKPLGHLSVYMGAQNITSSIITSNKYFTSDN